MNWHRLMWANDFPHSDSTWPWSQDDARRARRRASPPSSAARSCATTSPSSTGSTSRRCSRRAMDVGLLVPPVPRRAATSRAWSRTSASRACVFPTARTSRPRCGASSCSRRRRRRGIRLGPASRNSVTRDPAVTASAALSLQVESGGRAVLGIGRGDSSVQRIGKTQDPVARFERYLAQVQAYLRGEAVDRDGFASRLEWLPQVRVPKVPVEVAATGPARDRGRRRASADRICFAVGADPEHLGAALAHRPRRGRARPAAIPRRCATARSSTASCTTTSPSRATRVRGAVATFARFSALPRQRAGRAAAAAAARRARTSASTTTCASTRAPASRTRPASSDEFVDWFAIAGPVGARAAALPRASRRSASTSST